MVHCNNYSIPTLHLWGFFEVPMAAVITPSVDIFFAFLILFVSVYELEC